MRYWNALCEMHDSVKTFLEFSLEDSCVRHYTYLKKYWTSMSEQDILEFICLGGQRCVGFFLKRVEWRKQLSKVSIDTNIL